MTKNVSPPEMARRTNRLRAISLLFSTAFLGVIPLSLAQSQMQQRGQRSEMQQMALQQQDEQMFMDMRRVSNWVNQYCIWNRRFPEQGTEFREAKAQLNQLVPNNPYVSDKLLLSQGLDADPVYASSSDIPDSYTDYDKVPYPVPSDQAANLHRIVLNIDQSLTELDLQQDQDSAPDEWTAPAGSIVVISNQQNLYVVWGAGRDGRPLKDPLSGKTQLIIGRYALLNYGE